MCVLASPNMFQSLGMVAMQNKEHDESFLPRPHSHHEPLSLFRCIYGAGLGWFSRHSLPSSTSLFWVLA